MEPIKVLVVEDDANIRDLLTRGLKFAGFSVFAVGNGLDAVAATEKGKPDVIVLDVMLPDMNGFGVTKKIRSMGIECPVLFLTARDEVEDKVTGLTIGGDDYMTKPFSLDEVVARLHAILRRVRTVEQAPAIIEAGEITINEDSQEVTINGELVEFSPTEYKLLRYLAENPNRMLSKEKMLDYVWEYDFNGNVGIVESYISYLRRKVDPLATYTKIVTKRGSTPEQGGYMLKIDRKA